MKAMKEENILCLQDGKTDFKPNALSHWPADIQELSDHLSIQKFHLFAPSGGGPYALAYAWKMPEKLLSVGLFGSVGPYQAKSIEGVNKPLTVLVMDMLAPAYAPIALKLILRKSKPNMLRPDL